MEVSFRKAEMADAGAIALLSRQLGYDNTEAKTRGLLEQLLADQNNSGVWVAVSPQQVLGWIQAFYALRLESGSFTEIGGMVVAENFRGRGIGRQMIDQVIGWSREKGVSKIRVRSQLMRTDTLQFYRGLGFKEVKQQQVFDLFLD